MKLYRLSIIFFLFVILLIPCAFADSEQYLMPGVSRDSQFVQDGTGVWSGRTPTQYNRAYTSIQSYYPVVADVDRDGNPEIIILADDNLVILNSTYGVGVITEQTLTHGTTSIAAQVFRVTPALFDFDSTGAYEIISFNTTHFLTYSYNGSELVLNQSAATGLNVSAAPTPIFQQPVIKCAQGIQWSSGNDTCVMPISESASGFAVPTFLVYDVTSNNVYKVSGAFTTTNDPSPRGTHLADGDNDGYLEAYFSRRSGGSGDLYIYKVEVSSTPSVTALYTHNLANNRPFTDIIVSDLYGDGGTLDITWGYSSDATNYDAITIRASDGFVLDASYCTVLTCPEGDMIGVNMWKADDTTYSLFSGDVCYYIRNYEESDPGANIDTVFCVGQYAGAKTQETEIINSQNFTNAPLVHQADLHGSTGLLLQRFTVEGINKHSVPVLPDYPVLIPVDAQGSGSVDIIGMNSTILTYLDDAYLNSNYNIVKLAYDTGNDVCLNSLVKFTVSVQDAETDAGKCYFTEKYANSTLITNSSNVSITKGSFVANQSSASIDYYADALGTYILDFNCEDTYHKGSPDTKTYTVVVTNKTKPGVTCNDKGAEPGSETVLTTTEQAAEAKFDLEIEQTLTGLGVASSSARNIIAIIAVLMIAALIFIKTGSIVLSVISVPATLLICFFLGLVGVFPLITLLIFCITILVYLFMTGRGAA